MLSKCIKVHKSQAQRVKEELKRRGVLKNLKAKREGDYVLLPVEEGVEGFEECLGDFESWRRASKIGSFDIVGDVAIVKFREGLDAMRLAEKIVREHRNIKKVALDMGVKGEERIRELKILIGENLITVHKEYGVKLKVDLQSVYFSPRLATERWRVVQEVEDGEEIFDMFAGVGPFSILIAKHRRVKIVASDINPRAIELLRENIEMNRVEGITPVLGDAREVAKRVKADRIIMNLPHSSFLFLDSAFEAAREGARIHYYEILPRENERERDIVALGEKLGREVKIVEKRKVHSYSPSSDMFSILIEII